MPVPKGKQKMYSKVVGHLQNIGFGREEAKDKADRAVMDKGDKKKSRSMKQKRASKAGY